MDDRNPAVGALDDGTILVTFIIDRSFSTGGQLVRDGLYTLRSTDNGYTWGDPFSSPIDVKFGASPYGKIIQLGSGISLLAVYFEKMDTDHEKAWLYRSTDEGMSWGDPTLIALDYNETGLTLRKDGSLFAAMRSTRYSLGTSVSRDGGRTWSDPKEITVPGEHPGDLIPLRDGRLLHTHGVRNAPYGIRAMISSDSGLTWGAYELLVGDAQSADRGYPSSVEVEPGSIATVYYGVDSLDSNGKQLVGLDGVYAKVVLWKLPNLPAPAASIEPARKR